jgi:pimeloyl-ACP methyl ester carboxylesterase
MWRDFPERVATATGRRVVAYSRPGFGRSSPRRDAYTPRFMHEEALEILPALRAALGIARPVLVGHSTGASMALIHAGRPESDVAGVVAMAPLTFVEEFNLDSIRAAKLRYTTTGMREKLARYHDDADAVFHGWTGIWLHPEFSRWSIAADLVGIRCPILAILGDEDPYSTPAQISAIERNAVDAARLERITLSACGHSPHRDEPDAVIAAIVRFVAELVASTAPVSAR